MSAEIEEPNKKAEYCEWDNHTLKLYSKNDKLVNIYYQHDIEQTIIDNHNEYKAERGRD